MKQPDNSKLCGHVCLAVILGTTLQEAITLIGHEKGTQTKELTKYFKHGRNRRWLSKGEVPEYALCISRPQQVKPKGNWHWVLFKDFRVLDPTFGIWQPFNQWCINTNLAISSYIPILIESK